jgi:hypothetical protein
MHNLRNWHARQSPCHDSHMGGEIWGTFSVKDHCRPNAFVREVLLFDRLVLPVPIDDQERVRWRRPNAKDPQETWNPERLDALRQILGSQDIAAQPPPERGWLRRILHHGRRFPPSPSLTWDSPWDQQRWEFQRSRVQTAKTITNCDAFWATRQILAMGKDLPRVIEAVAAFPSAERCREELKPSESAPSDLTGAQALLMLATPLLVPQGNEGKDFGPLRAAAALARDDQFRRGRQAYYDWMREFVKPLQSPGQQGNQRLTEIKLDRGSLKLAEEELQGLAAAERHVLGKREQRRWWKRTEYAMTVISIGATAGLALTAPLPALGVAGPVIGFGGWIAGKLAVPEPPEERPLGGAAMFVMAQRRLGW